MWIGKVRLGEAGTAWFVMERQGPVRFVELW